MTREQLEKERQNNRSRLRALFDTGGRHRTKAEFEEIKRLTERNYELERLLMEPSEGCEACQ